MLGVCSHLQKIKTSMFIDIGKCIVWLSLDEFATFNDVPRFAKALFWCNSRHSRMAKPRERPWWGHTDNRTKRMSLSKDCSCCILLHYVFLKFQRGGFVFQAVSLRTFGFRGLWHCHRLQAATPQLDSARPINSDSLLANHMAWRHWDDQIVVKAAFWVLHCSRIPYMLTCTKD